MIQLARLKQFKLNWSCIFNQCLSLPLQPAAPGNEVSNLLFMYDMEQLLRSNKIIYSNLLTKVGEIRKSSILKNFAKEIGIHSSFHRFR